MPLTHLLEPRLSLTSLGRLAWKLQSLGEAQLQILSQLGQGQWDPPAGIWPSWQETPGSCACFTVIISWLVKHWSWANHRTQLLCGQRMVFKHQTKPFPLPGPCWALPTDAITRFLKHLVSAYIPNFQRMVWGWEHHPQSPHHAGGSPGGLPGIPSLGSLV